MSGYDRHQHLKRRRLLNEDDLVLPSDYPSPLPLRNRTSRVFALPQVLPSSPQQTLEEQQRYEENSNVITYRSNDENCDDDEEIISSPPSARKVVEPLLQNTKTNNPSTGLIAEQIKGNFISASIPKFVNSPLTSENIESALSLLDRNIAEKHNSSDELLQVFHDLYRWSRLEDRNQNNYFKHEFVWELSGISRVLKFLKAHKMGEDFLCQLLQTDLPFNE
mmetsp:Transcript_14818/g.41291  ORF Transcript_14818/g.41291 Transcript_14818/m.41291 type:complete len:221 (+) Transcript_14818:127-789(+)|eukprot:CAMPEP_0172357746 /NCGR_PEP_ID=MMETSP1060-20121228/2082_1 /TAXON_ID=37318 /ORGANISM="Pseudo-nitzschia pungens, Strain cf. cingulata" /LENGTH=220 /DNA_ID=CAMNT_0013078557 /DNA_START=30 /DNA_END=692 /DNA_ORIENTATION=-